MWEQRVCITAEGGYDLRTAHAALTGSLTELQARYVG